jgi:hypothetical protein
VGHFSRAFADCQTQIVLRIKLGAIWPLLEIFGDKTKKNIRYIHDFLDPILEDALERNRIRNQAESNKKTTTQEEHDSDATTLLDHLVSVTQGK